jgi:hypothetical protein
MLLADRRSLDVQGFSVLWLQSVVGASCRGRPWSAQEFNMDEKRALLRHAVATVAYRGAKAVGGAPASFASYSPDGSPRTAVSILAHIGDLYDWVLSQAKGAETWSNATPLEWGQEVARFFAALKRFDDFLASDAALALPAEKLFQGAIADSLTHVGQLAMLRRLSGAKIKAENYSRAEIVIGRLGADQAAPEREF